MAPYVAAELGDPAEIPGSMPERLTELLAPTLIFHGKRDAAVPAAFATPAGNLIPQSEVILLDAGHFLPMNESDVIARELMRFFIANRGDQTQWSAIAAD
jgi:pimeloyl-ACP methyl ester carboxylesterase